MPNPLFDAFFGKHAGQTTPFLHLPDGTTLTHSDFLGRAAQFAHALTACGVETGDRVAVQIGKSADNLALYAACVQTGAIFLPLNTAYTATELRYFVEDSGARLFVCDPKDHETLAALAPRVETLGTARDGTLADLAKAQPTQFDTVERSADDLAAFLYTSGTTGRSKGAMLTQGNLLSNSQTLADLWRFSAEDVLLHALPIYHTHGLFVATNVTLQAGGAMILLPKFDTQEVLRHLPRATAMMGVPTFYTRLLDDPHFTANTCANMRLFVSGSAPLLAETHRQFESRTGHRILERYGMTETNMNTSNPYDGDRRAGTVGLPLPDVELKVCDAEGQELPRGEIGTLEVRGPNVFKGYWQMPEKTAAELRADGFFITGDLAVQAPDGYVTIVGRGKDLIISGGFNVYPKEVEDVLDAQPGVLESAVIGVPHPDFGEGVVAVIVPEAGVTPDHGTLSEALKDQLAAFKRPKHLETVESLPRNTMGKVQKAALRDRFKAQFDG
ncbi:MAG: malonyl-CoA synthase [Rhodobacterales bacterium]|nr:MAG: malonyl-CoA synthase [Rhodobacterales bacterium]